jgi:hypothetical protein
MRFKGLDPGKVWEIAAFGGWVIRGIFVRGCSRRHRKINTPEYTVGDQAGVDIGEAGGRAGKDVCSDNREKNWVHGDGVNGEEGNFVERCVASMQRREECSTLSFPAVFVDVSPSNGLPQRNTRMMRTFRCWVVVPMIRLS